jgi:UDP-N-acetylglucosamine diphosphorylase/glucosamine-1-phosphate N-acetyltransferase
MRPALVLFEDEHWRDLRPLTDVLPVPALAFGASTLGARWEHVARRPLHALLARTVVAAAWPAAPPPPPAEGELVLVNAAALPGPWFDTVLGSQAPAVFASSGVIVAARVDAATIAPARAGTQRIEDTLAALSAPVEVDARRIAWAWDVMAWNADAIAEDLANLPAARDGEVHPLAALLAPERIAIGSGARIDPFAVLDARPGPIRVDEGAWVLPHTVVTGPCVIGPRTQVLGGFVSRSTFGPECRVQGEIEECVWQGYGNKRHHGFVGHSILGEWVNLGALTTTSDLKNNYGMVRVVVDGREVDSGSNKVGSLIGAHVKTGIGTLLPTGGSIGVGSNLFAGGTFAPRALPPFAWWDGERLDDHRVEPFLRTARIAMSRRGREMTAAEENLMRAVFEASHAERERARPQ